MSDSIEEDESTSVPQAASGPITWAPTPGVPVYGYTPATPPPDLTQPWLPPMQQVVAHATPPLAPPAPAQSPTVQQPPPMQYAQPAPPPQHAIHPALLNAAVGPAITPEERAMQLGLPTPPRDDKQT